MADQQAAPAKSADEVKKSESRSQAEQSQSQTRANFRKGDDDRAHEAQGRSLEYASGPGRDAYQPGLYQTDAVNDLPHLQVHFDR